MWDPQGSALRGQTSGKGCDQNFRKQCGQNFRNPQKGGREARYLIIDWGAALGAWGGNVIQRGRWNAEAFAAQNEQLITGVKDDVVSWGYAGQRTADAVAGITIADVRWIHRYLGPISHEQIAAALRASGGNDQEVADFTNAIRARIDLLGRTAARNA